MDRSSELEDTLYATLGRDLTLRDVEFVCLTLELYRGFLDALLRDIHREERGLQTVRLLDFDMIYSSFWRAIPRQTNEHQRLFGVPQSTYHFFEYNKRPFCLPWGTQMEMAQWVVWLAKQSNVRSTQLEKRLNSLVPSQEPLIHSAQGQEEKTALRQSEQDMLDFDHSFNTCLNWLLLASSDLSQLSSIHNSKCRMEAGELKEGGPLDAEYYKSLDTLWQWLESVRIDRTKANWADAYNLAYYAATRRYPREGYHTLFASGTGVVAEAPIEGYLGTPRWPSVSQAQEKPVIPSRFLTFATAFEQYCGHSKRDRRRTLVTAARESLEAVIDAQNDFQVHGMKADWRDARGKCRDIPWREFAADKFLKRWAWQYVRWRAMHLADVLAVFEHYGTTDDQLRNSYMQAKAGLLEEAMIRRRDFRDRITGEDWGAEFVANVRRVSQRIIIGLTGEFSDNLPSPTSEDWRRCFQVEDHSSGGGLEWVVRLSVPGEPMAPLAAEIKQTDDNQWTFLWPSRLDLAHIVRFGPGLLSIVISAPPTTMVVSTGESSIRVDVDDLDAIGKAVESSPLDFEVEFEVDGTILTFVSDSTSYPDRQGIDVCLRTQCSPEPSGLAQLHRLTSLCAAPDGELTAMFEAALCEGQRNSGHKEDNRNERA